MQDRDLASKCWLTTNTTHYVALENEPADDLLDSVVYVFGPGKREVNIA